MGKSISNFPPVVYVCFPAMPGWRDAEPAFSVKCGGKALGQSDTKEK